MNSRTSALKSKVIGATSDVLSAPARLKAKMKIANDYNNYNVLHQANRLPKRTPTFDASGNPTDAFKVKSVAEAVKNKLMKK